MKPNPFTVSAALVVAMGTAPLVLTTASANAATFNWTYVGVPCDPCANSFHVAEAQSGSGTLVTGPVVTSINGIPGLLITSMTGTWNGIAISSLVPPPSPLLPDHNDNILYLPPSL